MFIVIEGIDGAGKSTMVDELYKFSTETLKKKTIRLKFPDYVSQWGEVISSYLNGEYRKNLNPWIINILYDCDKFAYKPILLSHLRHNDIVILDRYYLSNIAYSCARNKEIFIDKNPDEVENEVIDNLMYLNKTIFKLPEPDITFVLDVSDERYLEVKNSRDLTRGNDIQERNVELIKASKRIYKKMIQSSLKMVKEVPYLPIEERLQFMVDEIGNLRL